MKLLYKFCFFFSFLSFREADNGRSGIWRLSPAGSDGLHFRFVKPELLSDKKEKYRREMFFWAALPHYVLLLLNVLYPSSIAPHKQSTYAYKQGRGSSFLEFCLLIFC